MASAASPGKSRSRRGRFVFIFQFRAKIRLRMGWKWNGKSAHDGWRRKVKLDIHSHRGASIHAKIRVSIRARRRQQHLADCLNYVDQNTARHEWDFRTRAVGRGGNLRDRRVMPLHHWHGAGDASLAVILSRSSRPSSRSIDMLIRVTNILRFHSTHRRTQSRVSLSLLTACRSSACVSVVTSNSSQLTARRLASTSLRDRKSDFFTACPAKMESLLLSSPPRATKGFIMGFHFDSDFVARAISCCYSLRQSTVVVSSPFRSSLFIPLKSGYGIVFSSTPPGGIVNCSRAPRSTHA